jgi:carboxyl-terminal processing protease
MRTFPLTDGSTFTLVIGHVRTPCGRIVQRQYQNVPVHEYYRLSLSERDTAGKPHCNTDGGRVVYGGGGIHPDLLLKRVEVPVWLAKLREADVIYEWTGGYATANPAAGSLDAAIVARPIPRVTITDFREFATRQGLTIPEGDDVDLLLQATLVPALARVRWGDAGFYRAQAMLDDDVRLASASFEKAASILGTGVATAH